MSLAISRPAVSTYTAKKSSDRSIPIAWRQSEFDTRRSSRLSPSVRIDQSAELEFAQAIQAYKTTSGRMFPTWSEILEVLIGLGYQK